LAGRGNWQELREGRKEGDTSHTNGWDWIFEDLEVIGAKSDGSETERVEPISPCSSHSPMFAGLSACKFHFSVVFCSFRQFSCF
jgi:hypothetical protein